MGVLALLAAGGLALSPALTSPALSPGRSSPAPGCGGGGACAASAAGEDQAALLQLAAPARTAPPGAPARAAPPAAPAPPAPNGSLPTGAPSGAEACAAGGQDPWATGSKLPCCVGLIDCLIPGQWNYLCLEACSTPPTPSPTSPPTPPPSGQDVSIIAFGWNIHWQCAEYWGHDEACRQEGVRRFGKLVRESGAQIAAAIEMNGAAAALPEWSSTNEYEDAVSLHVAPGWRLHKHGGGNICCNGQRGLAVALAAPPRPVAGCPLLCLMVVHPGHYPIELTAGTGKDIVLGVCGRAAERCAIAIGDWNVDAGGVAGGSFSSFSRLAGSHPTLVAPNSKTCCHPSTCCRFDHLATNIAGAKLLNAHVWGYQMTGQFPMTEEHMPIGVTIAVPGSARAEEEEEENTATNGTSLAFE